MPEEEKQDDPIETLQSPPSSFQMKGFPMIAGTSSAKDEDEEVQKAKKMFNDMKLTGKLKPKDEKYLKEVKNDPTEIEKAMNFEAKEFQGFKKQSGRTKD